MARLLGAALLCMLASVSDGCKQKPPLAQAPQLASEDFGTGVTLGMELESARASGKAECITVETLNQRSPYDEVKSKGDLIFAVYSEEDPLSGDDAAVPARRISSLRAYLTTPDKSKSKLGGQPAAMLTPENIVAMFGPPELTPSPASDGNTYMCYYFAVPESTALAYKLTTSHNLNGECFAVELSLVPIPD